MNGRHIIRAVALGVLLLIAFDAPEVWSQVTAHAPPPAEKDWLERYGILGALITAALTLLGYLLVIRRDQVARTYCPKIETAIECAFFPRQGERRPIELRFMVANKGGARSRVSALTYWIRGIAKTDALGVTGDRLDFTQKVVAGEFRSLPGARMFVDPETTQAFARPCVVAASLSLILVRATVHCEWKPGLFALWTTPTATYIEERVFQLPDDRVAGTPTAVPPADEMTI
jgi:hypothetical protein